MKLSVVYAGTDSKKRRDLREHNKDVIILLFDKWDDFNYKTTFPTECRIGGESVEVGSIQILIDGEMVSFAVLDSLVAEGWNGVFPIPGRAYISTPASLSFYEQIGAQLGLAEAVELANLLHDASYLTRIEEDEQALRLVAHEGFRKSLQREQGSVKAYLDGWKFFQSKAITVGNYIFSFRSTTGGLLDLSLKFLSDSLLPHDINVLIGPNGVGKSQLLQQIVRVWLNTDAGEPDSVGFNESPNLNQIVVVSYSPFELFPVDTSEDKSRKDHDVYRYFGLRGRKRALTDSKRGSDDITLSRDFPKANAARSLLDCLGGDQKFGAIKEWSNKLKTMERVLKQTIDFDYAAVAVDGTVTPSEFFVDYDESPDTVLISHSGDMNNGEETTRYIPVTSSQVANLKLAMLRKHVKDRSGVVFLKNDTEVHLSSGQRLFSYIVINILGAIRRNSLILIDEPELFLHPTLEIAFIRMLKSILSAFGSKALIATHSVVTVREIPRDCVHVLAQTQEGIVINMPPFETFGGDVQKISSYVFGDKSVSKPYEDWIRARLGEFDNASALITALGDNINEELLIQINAMGDGLW
jgi:predicted ATPase